MLKSIARRFQKKTSPFTKSPAPCMICGRNEYLALPLEIKPDFDPAIYDEPELATAFLRRDNGVCFNCGIVQSFSRPTHQQLVKICQFGKDVTTSNEVFHRYPVPQDFRDDFNKKIFETRIQRWKQFFADKKIKPTSSLFLRPFFGAVPQFIAQEYGSKVAGVDISPVCMRTTREIVPSFQELDGIINGVFEGAFLNSGPYDAIFVFHVLVHSCDVVSMLKQLRSLLSDNGVIVFSSEVVRKLHNPFHMFHPSEVQLTWLLREHFRAVERISNCAPASDSLFIDGKEADLIVWK